jgi:hypothetical protein
VSRGTVLRYSTSHLGHSRVGGKQQLSITDFAQPVVQAEDELWDKDEMRGYIRDFVAETDQVSSPVICDTQLMDRL